MNEFNYGVGRIRALEARMLTAGQLERMAAAADFESAFGVLSEPPYAENLPKLKKPFDFEELVEIELIALKSLMDHLAPANPILSSLFKKYDYLNLKILLRSFFSRAGKIDLYAKAGTIEFEKLRLFVFEGIKEFEDQEIFSAAEKARQIFEKTQDPQNLDIFLDKHYYANLKQTCDSSSSLLVKNMVNHQIDLTNIKILLRTHENAFLEPGLIDKDILLDLRKKSAQDIISKLNFTIYFPEIAPGIEYFAKYRSFYLLEKLMDNFIIDQFRKAKYLSSGIEPLVGFYLAKETEIKSVRLILISKKNQLETERIKERLRLSYA